MSIDILDDPAVKKLIPEGLSDGARGYIAQCALEAASNAEGTSDPVALKPLYVRTAVIEALKGLREAQTMAEVLAGKPSEDA